MAFKAKGFYLLTILHIVISDKTSIVYKRRVNMLAMNSVKMNGNRGYHRHDS